MAKYRIVKLKHFNHNHAVQKKILGFWFTVFGGYGSYLDIKDCEMYIESQEYLKNIVKNNPRNIVVKTY